MKKLFYLKKFNEEWTDNTDGEIDSIIQDMLLDIKDQDYKVYLTSNDSPLNWNKRIEIFRIPRKPFFKKKDFGIYEIDDVFITTILNLIDFLNDEGFIVKTVTNNRVDSNEQTCYINKDGIFFKRLFSEKEEKVDFDIYFLKIYAYSSSSLLVDSLNFFK